MSKIAYTSKAGAALVAMFAQYAQLAKKSIPELMKKQGAELSGNLYLLTPRADKTQIQQKMESLGNRFKRAPRAFALKVGPKSKAFFKANASGKEATARKLRNKAKKQAGKVEKTIFFSGTIRVSGEKVGGLRKGLTVTEEKFAATMLRMGRRTALAASWVPAMRKLGSKLKVAKGAAGKAAEKPMSEALLYGNPEAVTIEIINRQAGIIALNNRTGFFDHALMKTVANMREYVQRKNLEMRKTFKDAAAKTK